MEEIEKFPYSSIVGALQYQSTIRANKRAILYPDPKTNSTKYASLTFEEFNNITNHLAEQIQTKLPSRESMTCALLAHGGIEYLLFQYALLKIENVIMFPISPRNSPSAIEYLFQETKTKFLVTTSFYLPMIHRIQQENNEFTSLQILLFDTEEYQIEQLLKLKYSTRKQIISNQQQLNKVVMIFHSSGSTAHPKAIRITNRYALLGFTLFSSINKHFWEENDVTLVWGALFHLLTFNATIRTMILGCAFALPLCVTYPPKPDELFHNIQVNDGITTLITVPSLLEQLIQELFSEKNHHIGLHPLQKLKFIIYAGAACPEELCKILVDNDVKLISDYGSTETNPILIKNYDPYDKNWKHMQIPPSRKQFLRIETPTENPNEKLFIHLPTDPYLAENISNYPNGCYTTGDIILEDPPHSQRYVVLGRQDDTLVHLNGEKTNPLPLEEIIRQSSFVQQVAIVGHNQFCTAALIQLNLQQTKDFNMNQIEEQIWKYVQKANQHAPSHSRILRQMIDILSNEEILPITDKGNLLRKIIYEKYSTRINQIYQQQQKNQIKQWTKESIKIYLKSLIENLNDCSQSIFHFGINSLQIIHITNLIRQNICEIPMNFLYENPSIDQMTEQLIQSNQTFNRNPYIHYQLTEQILNKYIQLIKQNTQSQRVFLLTGATGSLGSFICRDLLRQSPTIVRRVYCLIRGQHTEQRLFQSFQQKQFDTSILKESLNDRLIILSSQVDFTDEHLGQTNQIYEELRSQVTDIIHSAWKMDFNQTIEHFELDCIRGIFNLLQLASTNHIRFHFISSISSASSGLLSTIEEEFLPMNSHIALPQGYGQSKYIAEHLCSIAKQFWNIPMNIYRIGQISGDTIHGIWNVNDMAAMMIYAGAGQLNQMPNVGEDINWIPIDICSASIIELVLKFHDQQVYHLLNPNTMNYQDYLDILRQVGLKFESVSPEQFLQTILTTKDLTNPLIRLSSFFEQIYLKKINFPRFQIDKTLQRCEILQNCPKINSNLIQLYLNYWKQCQLLN